MQPKDIYVKRIEKYSVIVIPVLFFLFYSFFDGVVIAVDSPSYIEMSVVREPLYPLFLFTLRTILFSNDIYLFVAVIIQGLLMAYAIYSFVSFLEKELNLNIFYKLSIIFLFLFVSLLCRYAAKRGSMYSNSILSESVAYPLFIIYFRYLLEYAFYHNKRSLITSCILSFLLISTRKQMIISLILVVIVMLYQTFLSKKKELLIGILAVCIFVIGSNKLLDLSYNYILRGFANTHTSGNRFMATMTFYCSEKEDVLLINNQESKDVFMKVFNECEDRGLIKNKSLDNWYDRAMNFCDSYDLIQLHVMWPTEREYVLSKYDVNQYEVETIVDSINDNIIKSIVPKQWQSIIQTVGDNFLLSIMTTVAAVREDFKEYSMLMFVAYILLLIFSVIKTRKNKINVLGTLILLSVIINNLVVSAVIFPQTRYTIYNMALFYTGFLLLLSNMINNLLVRKY